jgi:hypothetical protein
MLALIIYKDQNGSIEKYKEQFFYWYKYYMDSGTKSEFKIFTDEFSDITQLGDFPVFKIKNTCPINIHHKWATYGDWLRADLYTMINKPFVYIDFDCIPMQSLDPLCHIAETMETPIATARLNGAWNSGVICFKESVLWLYSKFFFDQHSLSLLLSDDRRYSSPYLYGENTWGRLCEAIGTELDTSWNVDWQCPSSDMKILHLYGGICVPFLKAHESLLLTKTSQVGKEVSGR